MEIKYGIGKVTVFERVTQQMRLQSVRVTGWPGPGRIIDALDRMSFEAGWRAVPADRQACKVALSEITDQVWGLLTVGGLMTTNGKAYLRPDAVRELLPGDGEVRVYKKNSLDKILEGLPHGGGSSWALVFGPAVLGALKFDGKMFTMGEAPSHPNDYRRQVTVDEKLFAQGFFDRVERLVKYTGVQNLAPQVVHQVLGDMYVHKDEILAKLRSTFTII